MPKARPANAEQLRRAIDRGETGDKAPAPDPAMAPLGTDAEAAGAPPSEREAAHALETEIARLGRVGVEPPPANVNPSMPLQTDRGGVGTGTALTLMALAAALCAILALVLLAA